MKTRQALTGYCYYSHAAILALAPVLLCGDLLKGTAGRARHLVGHAAGEVLSRLPSILVFLFEGLQEYAVDHRVLCTCLEVLVPAWSTIQAVLHWLWV